MNELMPTKEGIAKLREIYREQYGVEISEEDAFKILQGLMGFLHDAELRGFCNGSQNLNRGSVPDDL